MKILKNKRAKTQEHNVKQLICNNLKTLTDALMTWQPSQKLCQRLEWVVCRKEIPVTDKHMKKKTQLQRNANPNHYVLPYFSYEYHLDIW